MTLKSFNVFRISASEMLINATPNQNKNAEILRKEKYTNCSKSYRFYTRGGRHKAGAIHAYHAGLNKWIYYSGGFI